MFKILMDGKPCSISNFNEKREGRCDIIRLKTPQQYAKNN
jgi:hypothetical protein